MNEKKIMLDVLEELELELKLIQNKAQDQITFYNGFHECAKQMIEIIISKMSQLEEEPKEPDPEIEYSKSPLIVDPE
jgi:hypothetical protein